MDSQVLREDIMHGLGAAKAGMEVAAKATSDIQNDVTFSALKDQLEIGEQHSKTWAMRIERAIGEVGEVKKMKNPIMEAIYDLSKEIRTHASDDMVRDLGIIANGQIALHYWIATFGTLRAYCEQGGFQEAAADLRKCLDEAKASDERLTEVATQLIGAGGQVKNQGKEQTTVARH